MHKRPWALLQACGQQEGDRGHCGWAVDVMGGGGKYGHRMQWVEWAGKASPGDGAGM